MSYTVEQEDLSPIGHFSETSHAGSHRPRQKSARKTGKERRKSEKPIRRIRPELDEPDYDVPSQQSRTLRRPRREAPVHTEQQRRVRARDRRAAMRCRRNALKNAAI
jgi:hypothetical protein